MKIRSLLTLVLGLLMFAAAPALAQSKGDLPLRHTGHYAMVETEHGIFVIELYPKVAPRTVDNFEKLVNKGFYNGLTFHRVEEGFVVQGGDPKGDGSGGPGYEIVAEIRPDEKHLRGSVATARTGDEVNPERKSSGSQFYICLEPQPGLDGQYTIFGGAVKGMNVVDQVKVGDHMKKITLSSKAPA
jgi:cyclophilin family peptidyl-prolyl cis-trans isomerase